MSKPMSQELLDSFAQLDNEQLAKVAFELRDMYGWYTVVREVLIYQHRLSEYENVRAIVGKLIDEEVGKKTYNGGH